MNYRSNKLNFLSKANKISNLNITNIFKKSSGRGGPHCWLTQLVDSYEEPLNSIETIVDSIVLLPLSIIYEFKIIFEKNNETLPKKLLLLFPRIMTNLIINFSSFTIGSFKLITEGLFSLIFPPITIVFILMISTAIPFLPYFLISEYKYFLEPSDMEYLDDNFDSDEKVNFKYIDMFKSKPNLNVLKLHGF